ncbi:asparagine synthase-related protein [Glaciihabitans sp. UYNi722]|uniref:asparagine synthase-related protein n=1 Tax=Glaciihabitans sp. UYNi722 TaxID=3156344 RepID=UPI00339762BE
MRFIVTTGDEDEVVRLSREVGSHLGKVPIVHSVGRSWIIGEWAKDDFVTAEVDGRDLTLLGRVNTTSRLLEAELTAYRTPEDAFTIFRRFSGSYFTIVSWPGQVLMFGTLSSIRQVAFAKQRSRTLASNDADLLRSLTGAQLETDILPLLLVSLKPPATLAHRSPWQGIKIVEPSDAFYLDDTGAARTGTRWMPPRSLQSLEELTEPLRRALVNAVAVRHRTGPVSTDLSGGMDSTTLAFLSHQQHQNLVTVFQSALDPSNDDQEWARSAHRHLPGAVHIELHPEQTSPWYTDWLARPDDPLDMPMPSGRLRGYLTQIGALLAEQGSTTHLTGIGGDELFHGSFSLLRSLVRQSPFTTFGAVRRAGAMGRWKTSQTYGALLRKESLQNWLKRSATAIGRHASTGPSADWEPPPTVPPWASTAVIDAVREAIMLVAEGMTTDLDPLDYEMLTLVALNGSLVRRVAPILGTFGISYEAPMLDDHIVELAMSVRRKDRVRANEYKPVLNAVARGIVPPELLGRQTKGDYSREAYAGLRQARPEILSEFASSRLEALGLIDIDAFRRSISGVHPDTRAFQFLDPTLATEAWLRHASVTALRGTA